MNRSNPRVILDTNVLIVSLPTHSKYHWVFEHLLQGNYDLIISNEILMEYEEQIIKRYGLSRATSKLDFLTLLPNVHPVSPSYRWKLITRDADDNKFVDCAVAANADFIVSNDKHFHVLKEIAFPSVLVIPIDVFEERLASG